MVLHTLLPRTKQTQTHAHGHKHSYLQVTHKPHTFKWNVIHTHIHRIIIALKREHSQYSTPPVNWIWISTPKGLRIIHTTVLIYHGSASVKTSNQVQTLSYSMAQLLTAADCAFLPKLPHNYTIQTVLQQIHSIYMYKIYTGMGGLFTNQK